MYKIIISEHFKKQLKRLTKKDLYLKTLFLNELISFKKQNAISIGKGVYKIRLSSNGKGKSGGYRVYVFLIEIKGILSPLCIYPKNEKEMITFKELTYHLKQVDFELKIPFKS